MTPRDRPPTPRASGEASMSRTPSPNRTRRSASAPPGRDGQTHEEVTTPSVQEVIQPQTDQQGHGNPDDNGGQPASDQSRPPCEHTRILGALVEHPQANLEEIQQENPAEHPRETCRPSGPQGPDVRH